METGRAGLLPFGRTLGHVNPSVKSPVNAYLFQYALTILFTVALPPGAVYKFIVAFAAYPVYVSWYQRGVFFRADPSTGGLCLCVCVNRNDRYFIC